MPDDLPRQPATPTDIYTSTGPAEPVADSLFTDRPQLPYLIPIMVFVLFMLPAKFGHAFGIHWSSFWFQNTPAVYTAKTLAAAALLLAFRRYYTPIRWNGLLLGVAVGLFGLFQWVGMEFGIQYLWLHLFHGQHAQYPRIFGGQDVRLYDPLVQLHSTAARIGFYIVRIGGPTLVVPFMEEYFWRDFLWRALIRGARFQEIPVGTFSWVALIGSSLLFATGHFQWPSAIVYGLMLGWLLVRTKSLGACIVAHATTNFALGLYVLSTHQWQFW